MHVRYSHLTNKEVIALTNNQKREDFLKTWLEWPVISSDPELGLIARAVTLPLGTRIISLEYGYRNHLQHTESNRHCYFQAINNPIAGISPFNDVSTAGVIIALREERAKIIDRRDGGNGDA